MYNNEDYIEYQMEMDEWEENDHARWLLEKLLNKESVKRFSVLRCRGRINTLLREKKYSHLEDEVRLIIDMARESL